jgi:hypothetical protein
MNLFEVATVTSPLGGAIGSAMAVQRAIPSTPAWIWAAIPVGLVCGFGCYRGLIRISVGKHDRNPDMPGWRVATILGVSFFAPLIAGALSYGLVWVFLYVFV